MFVDTDWIESPQLLGKSSKFGEMHEMENMCIDQSHLRHSHKHIMGNCYIECVVEIDCSCHSTQHVAGHI